MNNEIPPPPQDAPADSIHGNEPVVGPMNEGASGVSGPAEPPSAGLSDHAPDAPLPNLTSIPQQLIDAWLTLPASQYLDIQVTRGDLDRLYGAIDKCLEAQWSFQQSMIDQTNGRTNEANVKLRRAQRYTLEGSNDLRVFMSAIMAASLVRRPS